MANRTQIEHNRRFPQFHRRRISETLPEYFPQLYPNLVVFMEQYYEATRDEAELVDLFEDGLFSLRDLEETKLKFLDSIFYEIANGARAGYFSDPRFIAKVIPSLIHDKGTEFSVELFFRIFFGEVPQVIYPKDQMLYVFSGDSTDQQRSKIGVEEGRVLQNGAKFQILSVSVQSGISFNKWEGLFRKFVHPAGFYLSSEVVTETLSQASEYALTLINDSGGGSTISFEGSALSTGGDLLSEMAYEIESDGIIFVNSVVDVLSNYDSVALSYIDSHYDTLAELTQLHGPTLDEDSDGIIKFIELSTDLERMDASTIITSYNADSA